MSCNSNAFNSVYFRSVVFLINDLKFTLVDKVFYKVAPLVCASVEFCLVRVYVVTFGLLSKLIYVTV